ncbi:hypothetical protein E2C01_090425 [Portunus trituberculatus]|uniref:Uncharacterized protein n=1 Tax=Portunus trituberculatus TaxID=210409 RepID=A0A5B7JS72_PORTR|nr:hypothetical protein [Portunus trituberculatus]
MVLLTFGSTLPDRVHIGPINLMRPPRTLVPPKERYCATSYALLAARSSAESAGPKTTSPATSCSVGAGGPVHLANRFALLSDDSVESSVRSDGNNSDMTNVTHVVDVHFPPASPKPLKGLTKRR